MTEPAAAPLLALVADDATRDTLRAVARDLGLNGALIGEGGAGATATLLQTTTPPAILIVDISDSQDPVLDVKAVVGFCGDATTMIAIGQINDVRFYRALRDAGLQDYLVKPISAETLQAALGAALRKPKDAAPSSPAAAGARTLAFIGARGGTGATTLAVSTAWALAQKSKKVVLLDLDLHFGSAALSLDIEPGRGLREILAFPDRIDTLLIDAAAGRVGENLRLLGAEEPLEDSFDLSPEGLIAVLETLSHSADFVVIDAPRVLGPISRQALTMADVVAIVTDLSLPAMRDTQRLVALIKGLKPAADIRIIANRVGGVGGEIGAVEFERAIAVKLAHAIRFDKTAASAAAESAKPLIEAAKTPPTLNALRAMVDALAGEAVAKGGEKAAPGSLLKRVFGA
jgi:pilus assembly protein CpaE